jgi:penicillin-binding protein 1B
VTRWLSGRRAIGLVVIGLGAALLVDAALLYRSVERRFAAGPGRLHTRFYADRVRIVPGMDVERSGLLAAFARLGYREDDALPTSGTWRRRRGAIEIHARAFSDPEGALPARTARLRIDAGRVVAVEDVASDERRTQLTLEPAWLGATWNGRWELRRPVVLDTLPRHVVDALLAQEDQRFHRHYGIDATGVARAVMVNLRARRLVEGGSTITQQVARSIFLTGARTWRRKLDEALLALLLERRFSKPEILELYLNEVYLGSSGGVSIVGYGQAAATFFGKEATALTVGEAATLAGIIRAPNPGSPLRHPTRARRRRDATLDRMVAAGMLKPAAATAAKRAPLGAVAVSGASTDAPAGVTGAFLLETARQELQGVVGAPAVDDAGLDVYTTMDVTMQRHAERGVVTALASLERRHRWLRDREPPLEASFVVLDLRNGSVRALVGGRDFPRRPFNRAVVARRQAGSTFKPFVFLSAFQRDPARYTPTTLLEDRPLVVTAGGDAWEPANYDQQFRGMVTMRSALERSLNVPTVRLALALGIDAVATTASDAGWTGTLPRVPALALGAADTTLLELAGLYTAFPREGVGVVPSVLRGAVGRDGAVAYQRAVVTRRAADPASAYLVHDLLEGVVARGTARRLRGEGFTDPLAGKTGTTNDYRDAWYVGYSPDLLAASWVGFDDGRPVKLPSSATALEVWSAAMRPILAARRPGRFPVPAGITFVEVDPESGLRATDACPGRREAFRAGTEPLASCSQRGRDFDLQDADEPLEFPRRLFEDWTREMRRLFVRPFRRR